MTKREIQQQVFEAMSDTTLVNFIIDVQWLGTGACREQLALEVMAWTTLAERVGEAIAETMVQQRGDELDDNLVAADAVKIAKQQPA